MSCQPVSSSRHVFLGHVEIEIIATDDRLTAARSPAAWVKGMAILPFGLALGFMGTALPFLLTRQGVALDRVAKISAAVFLPTVWAFLFKPFLDSGFRRSTYCLILTATASLGLAIGVAMLTPSYLWIAVPALTVATFSMVLYSGSALGWMAQVTGDHERGAVGGWINVASLGSGALGSNAVMSLLKDAIVSQRTAGLLMGGLVWLGATPLLFFPKPLPPQFGLHQVFTKTVAAIWRSVRRRECLVGFALLLSPAAGTAVGNLQSGLGKDFHASETTVIWLTGIASAIACSIGSLVGGRLADRFPRGYVYLFSGLGTAVTAIATALLPRTAAVFIASTLLYNLGVGFIYASYSALGLELTGDSPVGATQLGLFAAAMNLSVNYMTRADGFGYHRAGATGLYLVDGLASVVCIVPLLFLVRAGRKRRAAKATVAA
jgi:MFS family permease